MRAAGPQAPRRASNVPAFTDHFAMAAQLHRCARLYFAREGQGHGAVLTNRRSLKSKLKSASGSTLAIDMTGIP